MRWIKLLKNEIASVLPAFIFFVAAFGLINLIEGFFIGAKPFSFYAVIIAAGVIAKTLIVINHLPFINAFPHKPLIWNIVWKTALYELSALIVRIVIRLVPPIHSSHSFVKGYGEFLTTLEPKRFIAIQLCYLALFLIFVIGQELTRALGPKHLRKMVFGK